MEYWISTYTGKKLDPFNPDPGQIDIIDIAHALSNICRFTGHSSYFYSVAQHSAIMAQKATTANRGWALLHDASEVYIADISSPVKRHKVFQGYKKTENKLQRVIFEKFGLYGDVPGEIKDLDLKMLATEARQLGLMTSEWEISNLEPFDYSIVSLNPEGAEELFLRMFADIFLTDFEGRMNVSHNHIFRRQQGRSRRD